MIKLNEEFIHIKKEDSLHVVSIYPDHNEHYKFDGEVVNILEICFREKHILSTAELEKILNKKIIEEDWKDVQNFLTSKTIFQPE